MATPATVATTEYATAEAASISRPPLRSSSIAPIRAYPHRPASANAFTTMAIGSHTSRPHG
ncbi:MAG: hypothetical protein K0R87_2329 [Pseudonocardia sp.]|nr:hypothetical protein [Pseudonocardia sp.]